MKKFIFTFILALWVPILAFSQTCVTIDSIYVTAKVRELGTRDIRFGIEQIAEDLLSENYCLSESGNPLDIEVYYFGVPKATLRIAGVERTEQVTQVGVKLHYLNEVYTGLGESQTEVRAVMIEMKEGAMPFEKMTVSSALKKALADAIQKLP